MFKPTDLDVTVAQPDSALLAWLARQPRLAVISALAMASWMVVIAGIMGLARLF